MFLKATEKDIDAVNRIYDAIHTAEENDTAAIGWIRGVYPVRQTAADAVERGDLYVAKNGDAVVGAAIINHIQPPSYRGAPWAYPAPDSAVLVLHTLVIDPAAAGKGLGRAFVDFYEETAKRLSCRALRMDTNARNLRARALYKKLGYAEIAVVPCAFNGIPDVQLVLLEKVIE